MTNFEFYKDEILNETIHEFQQKWVVGQVGEARIGEKFTEWLYAEHVEPIMLERWEYDLLTTSKSDFMFCSTKSQDMKNNGYFKGITDTSMLIGDILKRAEIIDCNTCKFECKNEYEYPCVGCKRNYIDRYERKETE